MTLGLRMVKPNIYILEKTHKVYRLYFACCWSCWHCVWVVPGLCDSLLVTPLRPPCWHWITQCRSICELKNSLPLKRAWLSLDFLCLDRFTVFEFFNYIFCCWSWGPSVNLSMQSSSMFAMSRQPTQHILAFSIAVKMVNLDLSWKWTFLLNSSNWWNRVAYMCSWK